MNTYCPICDARIAISTDQVGTTVICPVCEEPIAQCKLCNSVVSEELFSSDFGICFACLSTLEAKIHFYEKTIPEYLGIANGSSDPDTKVMYLKLILDFLYDYKINYYDNGVDALTENIEDMIDTIIEGISNARL